MVLKECYKRYTIEKSNLLDVNIYNKEYLDPTHDHGSTNGNQDKMHKQLGKQPRRMQRCDNI